MSQPNNGRSLTTPHLRLNSGSQDPVIDDVQLHQLPAESSQPLMTSGPPSPSDASLLAIPPRLYSSYAPRPRSISRPATARVYSHEANPDFLTVPDPRQLRRSRSLSRSQSLAPLRRTSTSSERANAYFPFPYSQSAPALSEDGLNTQTVVERFAIVPDTNLIMRPEEEEMDDYLHNPDAEEKAPGSRWCSSRGLRNIGCLALIFAIVVALAVTLPVLLVTKSGRKAPDVCETDPMCLNSEDIPLLENVRTGLIDPDTPDSAMKITSAEGKEWELVFSDEFNRDGRTFFDGDDPYFQGVDIWYGVTQDLEWYDPDAVTTKDGVLEIRFDAYQNHFLNYRSGMIQSWNKLCFTGGRLEASISLPGRGDVAGLWPGFWTMGNLGRPGYPATTDGMWPYSYSDICDAGISPNQSSPDGLSFLPGMKLPACTCDGEDHPTPGKSRSAPEIDVIEASAHMIDEKNAPFVIGDVSQSCQIAPFDIWYVPNYDFVELYDPRISMMNQYRGGPYQQAVSGITNLNNDWYDGKEYQIYAFEYEPGANGYVTWFVGPDKTWKLDGRALGPNGNVGQRIIPNEPMALIMNLGMSNSFVSLNMTGLAPLLPATMRFDYVRIYQDPGKKSVTCDPEGMETTDYIEEHKDAYMNPNLTLWEHTDWKWPKNSLIHGCDE